MSSAGAGGSSHRRGQYTNRACNECRRRRSKCDGARPTCGSCSFYGHQCSWGNESDAHRPPTKQFVETLRVKVQVLENELARLLAAKQEQGGQAVGAVVPAPTPTPNSPFVAQGTRFPSQSRPTVVNTLPAHTGHTRPSPWLTYLNEHSNNAAHQPPNIAYQFIFNIDSNLPPNKQSEASYHSLVCDWNRHLPSLDGIQLTRLEHDTLLDRCFKYSSCWLMSIVPQFFLCDMLRALAYAHESPGIKHYSPLLHCSLLALATAFSDDPMIQRPETRHAFAEKAKQLLHDEIRRPSLCLAQSLAFLSEYHCGLGDTERGYMYLGIGIHAVRALDFGKLEFRPAMSDWCFWSIYSQDKIMSLELSIDSDLRSMNHLVLGLPRVDWELDQCPWPAPASGVAENQGSRLTHVFAESCKLMLIAESIICLHHPTRPTTPFAGDNRVTEIQFVLFRNGQVVSIMLTSFPSWKLDAWLSELPTELSISDNSSAALPHIIMTNMFYWWLILLLHQPFYRPVPDRNAPPVGALRPFGDLSDILCDRAARKIMFLVQLYGRCHGLRFFPRSMIQVVQVAGTLLLKQLGSVSEQSDLRGLVMECVAALRNICHTWQCAEKCESHLKRLLNEQYNQTSAQPSIAPINTSWPVSASAQQLQSAESEHEVNASGYGTSYSHSSHEVTPQ